MMAVGLALWLLQAAAPVGSEPALATAPSEGVERPLVWPTLAGPAGLFRVVTAPVGAPGTFRVGLHGEYFQADSFLVQRDSNARAVGTVAIGVTPWRLLELYAAFRGSANRNARTEASGTRGDPEVLTALGDPAFGVKGNAPFGLVSVGADLGLKLLSSVSGISLHGDSTNLWATAIASVDLRSRGLPLEAHANAGYLLDRSSSLVDFGNPPRSAETRTVASFGYGIGRSRARLAAALDAPLRAGSVELLPFAEYHAEIVTGDPDRFYDPMANPGIAGALPKDQITGRVAQYLTVGLRAAPWRGLLVDLGSDVGLSSVGFEFGSPTPPWNLILGASYSFDPFAGRTVTRTVAVAAPAREGRVRGRVRGQGGAPVGGALIEIEGEKGGRLATTDEGRFASGPLAPGTVALTVARDGYQPAHARATVVAGRDTEIDVALTPRAPAARLHGRVTGLDGEPLEGASARLSGRESRELTLRGGAFAAEVAPGSYAVHAEAPGRVPRDVSVEIREGADEGIDLALRPRPAGSHVELRADRILVKGSIHFHVDAAEIETDSQRLLDEVAALMADHPELRRVRVEGHTDSTGRRARNQVLSQSRAEAVAAYLRSQGIAATRLEAQGLGSSRPLAPNFSKVNKAKNRRVEFHILETAGAAPAEGIKP